MSQELASDSGAQSGKTPAVQQESSHEHSIGSPSHPIERFGVGVTATILLGAVVGVALVWALGASATVGLFVAVGIAFVVAPVIGLLLVERDG